MRGSIFPTLTLRPQGDVIPYKKCVEHIRSKNELEYVIVFLELCGKIVKWDFKENKMLPVTGRAAL